MTVPTVPLRSVADVRVSNVDKKSDASEKAVRLCNYTDVYYNEMITEGLPLMTATATRQQIVNFGLMSGDSIITKDSETVDDIGVPSFVPMDLPGVVCGYHLALIRPQPTIDPRFLSWALHSRFVSDQLAVRASGVTRFGLTYGAIKGARIPLPPLGEQRRIADFLDDQVTRIGQAIQLRKRQTELFRTSLASRLEELLAGTPIYGPLSSVTDPNRPVQYGIVLPGPDFEGGIPVVKGGDVAAHRMSPDQLNRTSPEIEAGYPRSRLQEGDILIAIRGSVGELAVVPEELAGANITQDAARIAPKNCDGRWLRWVLQTPTVQQRIASRITGATVKGINIGDLRRVRLPIPDSQQQVSQGLMAEEVAAETAQSIKLAARSASLLEERKRSLITAAVTGEFDVSSASVRASGVAMGGLVDQ